MTGYEDGGPEHTGSLWVRLRLAWHVFRGRPLCYRMRIKGTVNIESAPAWIYNNRFEVGP